MRQGYSWSDTRKHTYTGQNILLQCIKKEIKDTQRSGRGTTLPFLTFLLLRLVAVVFWLGPADCSPRPPVKRGDRERAHCEQAGRADAPKEQCTSNSQCDPWKGTCHGDGKRSLSFHVRDRVGSTQDWGSRELGSAPSSAISLLCDHGQVTSPLCTPVCNTIFVT